jgi:hypothetical protein
MPVTAALFALVLQLSLDGKPLAGGEVCWFGAGSPADPVARFTSFTTVTCRAADHDLQLPQTGIYNVFARHSAGLVSPNVVLLQNGHLRGAERIELVPARRVPFDRPLFPGEQAGVYVESTGVVLPLVPGEKEVLVPRDAAIVPLFIRDHVIQNAVAVGVVPDAAAFARWPARTHAVAMAAIAGRPPIDRLDPLLGGSPAIAFFRDVPDAPTVAHLSGRAWIDDEVAIEHGRATRPLRAAPTSVVTVRWSVLPELAEFTSTRSSGSCASAPVTQTTVDHPALAIEHCGSIADAGDAKTRCTTVRTIALDRTATSGEVAAQGLEAGAYRMQLAYPGLPAAFATLQFDATDSTVDINLKPDRFFGRVTREGKPYHAFVAIGDGAVSDTDTGEYVAFAAPAPRPDPSAERRFFKDPNPITVRGCQSNEASFFVPDAAPVANSRFDIDLTPTSIAVSVVDAGSGAAIPDASVTYRVMRRDDLEVPLFEGSAAATDPSGKTVVRGLPQTRRTFVCASHENYAKACAPPFTLDTPEQDVSISLTRSDARRGTVRNAAAAGGHVVWVTPAGDVSETSTIADDGSFSYARPHDPGELVCVVSATAPLLVLRYPSLGADEPFDISYAGVAIRDFHAVLPPSAHEAKGFLGMSIGDAVVPLSLLSQHLAFRDSRPVFLAPRTIEVPQIAATAPVTFLFAPMTWAEANSGGRGVDFFYLPAARALPRVPPDSRGVAILGQ